MTKELWARLDEIDGDTLIKGAELENWRAECRHQAKHNSDPKDREVFAAAAKRTCITRKHARLIAWMAEIGDCVHASEVELPAPAQPPRTFFIIGSGCASLSVGIGITSRLD